MEKSTKMLRCIKEIFGDAYCGLFGGRPRQNIAWKLFHPPGGSSLSEFLLEIYWIEAMPGEQFVEFRAVALRDS